MKYVRFVVGWRSENPWELTGIITETAQFGMALDSDDWQLASATFKWLNNNLPVPPYPKKHDPNAISWFIEDKSTILIRTLRPLIKMLRSNGLMVRTLRTNRPGRIIYKDDYQVVAICPACKFK